MFGYISLYRWHFPPFWLQPRAPRISSRRFCWHRPAPLTPSLIRTSQTGRLHMVPSSPSDHLPVNQSVCDKPGILFSSISVELAISDSCQKARFLAAAAPHSGDWLLALPGNFLYISATVAINPTARDVVRSTSRLTTRPLLRPALGLDVPFWHIESVNCSVALL